MAPDGVRHPENLAEFCGLWRGAMEDRPVAPVLGPWRDPRLLSLYIELLKGSALGRGLCRPLLLSALLCRAREGGGGLLAPS